MLARGRWHRGHSIEMSPQATNPGRSIGVIEAKIALPRVQPGMLRRSRLLEIVDGYGGAALTVVNAPAGYGKTTFLRLWCIERSEAVMWMTLDAADDDPVRLWMHLATAVERLGDGLGRRALMCLGVRGAPVETAVDELMNGLVAYGRPVAIVLDDLHAVGSERSLRSIAHAIERLAMRACSRRRARTRRSVWRGCGREGR
jgi:LuxR family maltose regulon positive regulatory protein